LGDVTVAGVDEAADVRVALNSGGRHYDWVEAAKVDERADNQDVVRADAGGVVATGAHSALINIAVPDLEGAHVGVGVPSNSLVLVAEARLQPRRLSTVLDARVVQHVHGRLDVHIEADPLSVVRVGALVAVRRHDHNGAIEEVRNVSHDVVAVAVVRVASAEVARGVAGTVVAAGGVGDNVGDGAESSRAGGIDNVDQLVHGVGPASACRVAHTGEVSEVREVTHVAVRVARRDVALALATVVVVAEALVVPLETHVGVARAALGTVHDTVGGVAREATHANSDVTRAGINEAADVAVARHSADNLGVHDGTANGDDVVGANARGVVAAKADRAGLLSVVHPHLHVAHARISRLSDRHVLANEHRLEPARLGAVLDTGVVQEVHGGLTSEVEAHELGVGRVGALVVVGGRD